MRFRKGQPRPAGGEIWKACRDGLSVFIPVLARIHDIRVVRLNGEVVSALVLRLVQGAVCLLDEEGCIGRKFGGPGGDPDADGDAAKGAVQMFHIEAADSGEHVQRYLDGACLISAGEQDGEL